MLSLGEAMKSIVEQSMPFPSDHVHICEHCKKEVPKITVNLLGVEKQVQPRCKCEVDHYMNEIREAEDKKRRNEIERKFSISNLGERFAESRFELFSHRDGSDNAFRSSKHYALTFTGDVSDGLLIWGDPGNGKSHLAAAICHTVKERGYIPVFQSVPELLERIRNTFNRNNKETEKEIMSALLECDLLILDDIGAEKLTDWVQDVLFRVVDGRYRQKRPTLYTTNYKPSELADKLGKRIYDRMLETSITVENKATSYRMELAAKRFRDMQKSG